MIARRRGARRRSNEIRGLLLIAGFFLYLLLLARERVETRERSRAIEELEAALRMARNGEALRVVELERRSDFVAVRDAARGREMLAAGEDQRVLLFEDRLDPSQDPSWSAPQFVARWFWHGFAGEVAVAQSSAREGGDVEEKR